MVDETPEQKAQRVAAERAAEIQRIVEEQKEIELELDRIALRRAKRAETAEEKAETLSAEEKRKKDEEQRKNEESLKGRLEALNKRKTDLMQGAEDAFQRRAITIVTGRSSRFWVIFIVSIIVVVGLLWWFGKLTLAFVTLLQILLFLSFVILILGGFWSGIKHNNSTSIFIAFAFILWGIDLLPSVITIPFTNIQVFDIGRYIGPPYAGFKFNLSGILSTNWAAVLASSIVFIFLFFSMIYDIIEKHVWRFIVSLSLIIIINQILNHYNILGLGRAVSVSYINYIFLAVIVIGLFLAFKFRNKFQGTDLADYPTFLFMVFVFSFFYVNIGWVRNPRAIIHVIYIIIFGFFYLARYEKQNPSLWHMLIPSLLIADFYGYGLLWDSGIDVLRFIPIIVIFVLFYCYLRRGSVYAMVSFIFVIIIFLVFTLQSIGVEATSIQFEATRGADYKEFYGQFKDRIRDIIEGRLEIATAGLYRGSVEKNRYESLGVYFRNIRAADPRFYTDEPITVWGSIRSKTYKDAVIINFSCYRWKDNKKIRADREVPNTIFPIFTLEDVDTECTFNPKTDPKDKEKEVSAGANTVTFSAEYNFGTEAYLKTYFIDRERFRGYSREGIDPLTEFGIKDKKPVTVFTNGPVEFGISAGPLVTVSEGYTIKPTVGITLTNRKEIQDKDKKIITKWDGKIKKITELILLTPPRVTLPDIEKCSLEEKDPERVNCPCSIPFVKYTEQDCKNTCEKSVYQPCFDACLANIAPEYRTSQALEDSGCIAECKTTTNNCEKECDFLFKVGEGEGPATEKYNAYALNVSSIKFRDLNKDIDKHRSFLCRFDPSSKVLGNTPITTRYFRVRARYDYMLENSVTVNAEQPPIQTVEFAPKDIFDISSVFRPEHDLYFEGLNPDLVAAIAWVESRWRHCCEDSTKNRGGNCVDSGKNICPRENVITSGSSYGIMQVQYNKPEVIKLVDDMVNKYCDEPKSIYERKCNIIVGIAILKQKYNRYKDGCQNSNEYRQYSNIKKACDECTTSSKYSNKAYSSYKRGDAAIRAYNGWGCDSRFDNDYMEKVREALDKIKNGRIIDNTGIRNIISEQKGDMFSDTEESGLKKPSPPSYVVAQYNALGPNVKISWGKSPSPDVVKYAVGRYVEDRPGVNIYEENVIDANKKEYTYIDTDDLAPATYKYWVFAYSKNGGYSQEKAEVTITPKPTIT